MYKIYIVEDDSSIASAIKQQAEMWDFTVKVAQDFRNILAEFASFSPHIVLLDISLPFSTVITGAVKSAVFQAFP